MSQVHESVGGANFAAKLLSGAAFDGMPNDVIVVVVAPGCGDWHATQVLSVDLF